MSRAGVVPGMDPKLVNNVVITNFAGYAHFLITFPYYWVFKSLGATWLSSFVVPLSLFFLAIPQVNRFGFTTASRLMLIAAINLSVYLYTASIGMETSIQNVYFFSLVCPLMLFRVSEWRAILFCVVQPILFWTLLVWKGSWFIPQTHFEPWAFHIMSPAISLTTAIMLLTCSFLISLLQQSGESKLQKAKDAAETSDRAKSRFLATMSHEIRTPMNGILGVLQLLMESDFSKHHKEDLHLMRSSGDLLLTIINDVLDFSKIEANKLALEYRLFNLHATVTLCKRMLDKAAADKGLSLSLDIALDCPIWVMGDETRYSQVVMNLANNAIKFTRTGYVRINLHRQSKPGGEQIICLSVQDTGIGITPENLKNLFQPFSQADSSTTREFGGTGLGLVISKRLTNAMQGDLTVESVFGLGSVFRFTALLEPGAEPLQAKADARPNETRALYRGKKALLVEDNTVNQVVASMMVSKLGFEVTLAGDGLQGVKAASADHFDVIFMDCQMPVMDGYEATRSIRNTQTEETRTVILALTANTQPEDREKCLAAGMDDFISKPILMDVLKSTLGKHLKVPA
jgi:signal transduction histidine kinase/CheY-like chemotaxis protein